MVGQNQSPDELIEPGTSGRFLVALDPARMEKGVNTLSNVAGVSPEIAEGGDIAAEALEEPETSVVFPEIAVAVVPASPEQLTGISEAVAHPQVPILAVEPEGFNLISQEESLPSGEGEEEEEEEWPPRGQQGQEFPPSPELASLGSLSAEYLQGYTDALQNLLEKVTARAEAAEEPSPAAIDQSQNTWGLQVTRASTSRFSGAGIRVAVLDTGLDLGHPDFQGRRITSQSFVPSEAVQDGNGHGTHCIGTACGPRQPFSTPRTGLPNYGCAPGSDIFVGKVASNLGFSQDAWILQGIEWVIANRCAVVCMPAARRVVTIDEPHSPIFEQAARRGLARGTLFIGVAGSHSSRPGLVWAVSHPANCPSIVAVANLDDHLQVHPASNRGVGPQPGGAVDIAGPGVNVHSSWPRPVLRNRISGTSMAAAHVAGIAALHAQINPNFRGSRLARQLFRSARRLSLPPRDVGAGLVQAP